MQPGGPNEGCNKGVVGGLSAVEGRWTALRVWQVRPREVSVTTTIAWTRTWPRGMWADRGISWRIEEEAAIEDRGEEGDGVIEYSLLPPLGGGGSSVLEARERERGIARGCPPALVRRHSFHRPSRLFILLIGSSFFLPFVFSAASPSFSAPTTPAFDSSGPNFNLQRRLNTRLCHLPPCFTLLRSFFSFTACASRPHVRPWFRPRRSMIYRYPDRVSDEAIFFQGEYRLALDHFASGIPLAAEIWVRSSGTRSTELVYVHHASEHSDQNAHLRRRKLGGGERKVQLSNWFHLSHSGI